MKVNQLLSDGIGTIAETTARFYLHNKEGRRFMLRMASEFRKEVTRN